MNKSLVILSGGQDSTTCLFWAKKYLGPDVSAITFDYGQRHDIEIESAAIVASMAGVVKHEIVKVGNILRGTSPLVNRDYEVEHYADAAALPGGLEKTFVPGRNALFLVLAANYAYANKIDLLVTGVCQEDSGGYPDCTQPFISAIQPALGQAMYGDKGRITIHTPLMNLTKAQSVELAYSLPGCPEALMYSHTCYDGKYPPNPHNHASLLRSRGFADAGRPDPLILRAKLEGLLTDEDVDDFGRAVPKPEVKKVAKAKKKVVAPKPENESEASQ